MDEDEFSLNESDDDDAADLHHDAITTIDDTMFRGLPHKPVRTSDKVIFYKCGDIHPWEDTSFPDAKVVHLEFCDKNFVYYWLKPLTFPNVNTIYLNSHPCQHSSWLTHFSENIPIYMAPRHQCYKERWYRDLHNFQVIETFPPWTTAKR